jgi:hypothetical protein
MIDGPAGAARKPTVGARRNGSTTRPCMRLASDRHRKSKPPLAPSLGLIAPRTPQIAAISSRAESGGCGVAWARASSRCLAPIPYSNPSSKPVICDLPAIRRRVPDDCYSWRTDNRPPRGSQGHFRDHRIPETETRCHAWASIAARRANLGCASCLHYRRQAHFTDSSVWKPLADSSGSRSTRSNAR